MKCRPVDEYGDLLPVQSPSEMVTGVHAVALAATARLMLPYGEWWEDKRLGFRIPEFLVSNARKNNAAMVANYVTSYISDTPEVRSVSNVQVSTGDLSLTYSCDVNCENESERLEVDENVLLSAIY